ncbi:MAG: hypothetical protein GF329_06705 [Candidatus Lokiarchaeota archaeon]|nr:hypothetical protein [Candidatus Lokiarchaeota archaeon]
MKKILPFWAPTKRIYPFTKDIAEIYSEIIHTYQLNLIKTIEDAFWSIFALDSVKQLDMIDTDRIEKLILDNRKGFKFCNQKNKKDDLHTLFYALSALKILNKLDNFSGKVIDAFANSVISYETNNGFVHCYESSCAICGGKTSAESNFYGIATLYLLDREEKIDKEKFLKIITGKIGRKNKDLVYNLLSLSILDQLNSVDKSYLDQISEFEDESGGFKFISEIPSISDTFWIVSLYSAMNWLKNAINLGRILEFVRGIYAKRKEKISFYDMDLKDYCFSTLIISFIYDYLTESIKANILRQLYEKKKVFYKEISETSFVADDIIDIVLNNLYKKNWFNATSIDNQEVLNDFLDGISRTRKFLVEEIIKRIKKDNRINLTEYANSIKSGAVIELTKIMMEEKIIIGKIETVGRFLRKEHKIFKGYMPEKGIKRRGSKGTIPYFDIMEEQERFPTDEREILDILEEMREIPDQINDKVFNLIDCDKVNLATITLKDEYKEALEFLNKSNKEIQEKFSNYKYLSKKYLTQIEERWSKILEETRIQLENVKNNLQNKIDIKKKSLDALKDLEEFQEFVQNNLKKIKNSVENITEFFQVSIDENKLEKNQDDILKRINKTIEEINQLTPNLKTQVEILNKVVDESKLMDNLEISGAKLEPLHIWLQREFLNKRSYTLKTLSEIKSKLFKRDELNSIIDKKKENFDKKIIEIKELIENNISSKNYSAAATILKDKSKEALKFIEKTNKYILDFINDTSNLIEGFDLVVDEIMDYWLNNVVVAMQNQIKNLKIDLEGKIISQKELDRRDKLDSLVEKNIEEVKKVAKAFKTDINELIKTENNIELILKELELKHENVKKIISTCHKQFNRTLKTDNTEFQNFSDTANVQIFKWNSFKESYDDKLKLIYDTLFDKILAKAIVQNQKFYPEGRVTLDILKDLLGIKSSEIKNRIKNMLNAGSIDGEFYPKKNQVTIFTSERKNIKNFEDKINNFLVKLNKRNKEIKNFYSKSCKKRQIETASGELFNEIKETFDISNKYNSIIKKEVEKLPDDAVDIKIITDKWKEFNKDLKDDLLSITDTLKKRIDFKQLINDSISIFNTKLNEISTPIRKLIERDKLKEAQNLLNIRKENFLNSINEMDESINESIQKEDIKHYKLIVSDLTNKWNEQKALFEEKIDIEIDKINQKIINKILKKKEIVLRELISKELKELKEIQENMEEKVYPQISIDVKIAQKKLGNMPERFQNKIKESSKEINSFIKEVSNDYRNFKSISKVVMNRYNKDVIDISDLFDQSYQMLEDEMIIKIIDDLKTAYGSHGVELGLISNTLKISKSHLRNRIIQLIASRKLKGILDPESDEYKFEEFVSEANQEEIEPHIITQKESLFKRFSNLLKKWYDVVSFVGACTAIGGALLPFTNIWVCILIPSISIIIAVAYVLIKHYLEKQESG